MYGEVVLRPDDVLFVVAAIQSFFFVMVKHSIKKTGIVGANILLYIFGAKTIIVIRGNILSIFIYI